MRAYPPPALPHPRPQTQQGKLTAAPAPAPRPLLSPGPLQVGVFAQRPGPGGGLCVLEYSELDPALAHAPDPTATALSPAAAPPQQSQPQGSQPQQQQQQPPLLFNWANLCMHYFRLSWLRRTAAHLLAGGGGAGAGTGAEEVAYHVARKRIPSTLAAGGAADGAAGGGVGSTGSMAGVKLELFIFDTFPLAGAATALVEVARDEEFAPVKNAPGAVRGSGAGAGAGEVLGAAYVAGADSPGSTARAVPPAGERFKFQIRHCFSRDAARVWTRSANQFEAPHACCCRRLASHFSLGGSPSTSSE